MKIHYRNDTGKVLRDRGGREIRPLDDFWSDEYEPAELGLTILEDLTAPIVSSEEIPVSSTPIQIDIPTPTLHPYLIETTVQAVSSGARIEVGFNRATDDTGPVDSLTQYCERIDTRRAYCLWLSGSGTARVIFKEVLN